MDCLSQNKKLIKEMEEEYTMRNIIAKELQKLNLRDNFLLQQMYLHETTLFNSMRFRS